MAIWTNIAGTLANSWRIARATFSASGLTAARTFTLPDAAGTVMLREDLDLANGVQGDILYRGASAWLRLAKPSVTGKVLTGGATPSWVGGVSLLASASPSSASQVDFNFTTWTNADFIAYAIVLANVAPASNTQQLYLRTSADGTTFDSGASNYTWTNVDVTTLSSSGGDTQIKIGGTTTAAGNTANYSTSGVIWIFNPSSAKYCKIFSQLSVTGTDGVIRPNKASGSRLSAAAVKGIRIMFGSSNIASGEIRVIGLGA